MFYCKRMIPRTGIANYCFCCLYSLFLFFGNSVSFSAPQQKDTYLQERITTGIDAIYAMRYADANRAFNDIIAKYPNEPTGYFFRSQIHLWKFLFNYSDSDYGLFLQDCDRAISTAEASLKQRPDNTFAQTIVGAVYGFRAMANFRAENFVKATLDGRSCYNYLNEVVKKNPAEFDAYLGMGMFHFGVAAMPSIVRSVANLAGLKGNLEGGLAEIRMAAEKSLWARNDAAMFLAMINVYYKRDFTQGLRYLNDLTTSYPTNVPVLYSLGNVELFVRKPTAALPYYQKVVQLSDTNFRAFSAFAHYRIGECYWRLNDFEKAKGEFQRFFKGRYERSFRGNALLRLALCYEMTGNRAEAVKGYAKCAALTPFEPDDRFASRRAKALAQKPLDAAQTQLIKGINCVESLRLQEAEQFLRPLAENTALSKELRSEAAYNLGETLREAKRNAEAITLYLKAIELEPSEERWVMPWSYYRIAEIHANAGKIELSRSYIEKAKVFSSYDFQEWLTFLMERDATLLKG